MPLPSKEPREVGVVARSQFTPVTNPRIHSLSISACVPPWPLSRVHVPQLRLPIPAVNAGPTADAVPMLPNPVARATIVATTNRLMAPPLGDYWHSTGMMPDHKAPIRHKSGAIDTSQVSFALSSA